jgi:hypothetical protein
MPKLIKETFAQQEAIYNGMDTKEKENFHGHELTNMLQLVRMEVIKEYMQQRLFYSF